MQRKLEILAGAAKYDVSCSSSGGSRSTPRGGIGNSAPTGICHSFTDDGRCVSLLKILFSNVCLFDCAYCVNRKSNDIPRATFRVQEVVDLTLQFYRRNLIEGLFLSSGIFGSPDTTMEALVEVARSLRQVHRFGGYIHLKAIPGASPDLVRQAGLLADRVSVNIEIPSEESLRLLAPEKDYASIFAPMGNIRQGILEWKDSKGSFARAPRFAPAGQSTQLIVGATPDSDRQILRLAEGLYKGPQLRRVYYSGYIPVNRDHRLPALVQPPRVREHRLYQADWLMRFYGFGSEEILDDRTPDLDLELDPKSAWALRHPEFFPVDLNRAEPARILRVPGIGVRSARLIVAGRRHRTVRLEHLREIGVVVRRAAPFIVDPGRTRFQRDPDPRQLRQLLLPAGSTPQLSLFPSTEVPLLA